MGEQLKALEQRVNEFQSGLNISQLGTGLPALPVVVQLA